MSKNNENILVPKLRFPEFSKDSIWNSDELGKLSNFFKGKGLAKSDIVPDGENPCVHYGELFTKYSEVIKEVKSYTNISDGFKSEANDVLMPTSDVTPNGLAKASCIKLDEIILGGDILIIRPKPIIYGEFLSRFIRHREREVLKLVSGTTVFHLYGSSFEKFRLIYPSINEQQKIASCLSSLDEVIKAESQKLGVLKEHKKGLLQNLFPQQSGTGFLRLIDEQDDSKILPILKSYKSCSDNVPKLRFKEFEDSGEWEEMKLGEIGELTSSKRVHLADYVSTGIPFFRGKEISQLKNNCLPNDVLYISEAHYEDLKIKYGVPKVGDILITAVGTLGNVYCIKNNEKFYFKDGNLIWIKNIKEDPNFLEVLLDSEKDKILASAIGSSQKALTMSALNKLEFKIPRNSYEQEKIADTLSSIDELINAHSQEVEALKLHKKGLLQGLFPDVNTPNMG